MIQINQQGIFLPEFALLLPRKITCEIAREAGLAGIEIVLTHSVRKNLDKILSIFLKYGLKWRFHMPFANAWVPNISPFDFLIWFATREIPLRVTAKDVREFIDISCDYQTPVVIHTRFMEIVQEIFRKKPTAERLVMLHTKPEPNGPSWDEIKKYLLNSDVGFALDIGYAATMMNGESLFEAAKILAQKEGGELHYYDAKVTPTTNGMERYHMINKNLLPGRGNLPLNEIKGIIQDNNGKPAVVLETFPTIAWAAFLEGGIEGIIELICGLANSWVRGETYDNNLPSLKGSFVREVFLSLLRRGEEGVIQRLELAALKKDWSK